jgi:hypothetical protein
MEAHGGEEYSSYSCMTSALNGVGGQRHALAALYPRGKDPRYPIDRMVGGPQYRSGHNARRKIFASAGTYRTSNGPVITESRETSRGMLTNHLDHLRSSWAWARYRNSLWVWRNPLCVYDEFSQPRAVTTCKYISCLRFYFMCRLMTGLYVPD